MARRSLVRAYVLHVAWFLAMCAFAGWHWSRSGLQMSVLLTLLTVPPVLYFTVRVHKLCRVIDPNARTVGWVPVLIVTCVLSPFESGLVLPLKNLLACNKLLRGAAVELPEDLAVASDDSPEGSGFGHPTGSPHQLP